MLVVNAGSSSLKLRLLDEQDALAGRADLGPVGDLSTDDLRAALDGLDGLGAFDAVGHRVVHGGERFREPVIVDPDVRRGLADLTVLAPLHQPGSLAALDAVTTAAPDVPAVACFDTAFHATLRPEAAVFAVPAAWRHELGLRRYGFHGLSHAYASRRAAEVVLADGGQPGRIVTCHLGAGASLAAVHEGMSVDTTMGFTPLDGLVMATRSGSVDPGALLWLVEHRGLDPGEVADALEHRSGLLGLAGTADMATAVQRAGAGDEAAGLAVAVYQHRLRAGIAAMAAALAGIDVLVFTGGVGENVATVRASAVSGLPFLGVTIDAAANAAVDLDASDGVADVGLAGAPARVLVVAAREDLEIARGVRALLT